MNYGFVIDNRKCIGCHACTTACKSEHEVPLGVNRTWVKYTETGAFPDTKRHFQVTRCNHCANPPCVHICPTGAMFQRKDGIVEFDNEICIGCKACMQACPYDAIYIDPETDTAAKCNYCAHRIEVGLEPACVIVCPEHAILSGDLDDPNTEIALAVKENKVTVRKPEQGTRPKLFYIDVEPASVVPMAAVQSAAGLWSEMPQGGDWRKPFPPSPCEAGGGSAMNVRRGGGESGGYGTTKMAEALMNAGTNQPAPSGAAPRETYNAPHRVPWHWPVPAYLVTKAISAGTFMIWAVCGALGLFPPDTDPTDHSVVIWATGISLAFALLTTVLLVADLSQPKRFYYMLIKPQWKSWLTKGAFVLVGFTTLVGIAWLASFLRYDGIALALRWPGAVLALFTAIYTAFLFAQAEGRDLWQSKWLAPHLAVQAVLAGVAGCAFTPLNSYFGGTIALAWVLGVTCLLNVVFTTADLGQKHPTREGHAAARTITRGHYSRLFQASILLQIACSGFAFFVATKLSDHSWVSEVTAPYLVGVPAVLSIIGLFLYEWAFVMAPQEVPNN